MDFFYKYKTAIFLLLFTLFSIFLGFILFSIFFKSGQTPGETERPPIGSGGFPDTADGSGQIVTPGGAGEFPASKDPLPLPVRETDTIAQGGLTKTTALSSLPGANFTSGQNSSGIQFYNQADGKFYKLDKNGQMTPLSDKVFYEVKSVAWANNKDKAVIEYPDGANIIYDFNTNKQITLPKHWEEFAFSPNDKQIVAKNIGLDPSNRWLTIANADGSNIKNIEPLGNNADRVHSSWSPNNQTVAVFTEGVDLNRQALYFVGQNQENFKSTIIEGRGFQSAWAPDGSKLIYSVYSSDTDLKPTLWIVNAQGESIGLNRRNLKLETWASKCSFANATDLYCAVPRNLEAGAGLFPDLANRTDDAIYKIDITSGQARLISVPETPFTISNITISENEKTLYFVDQNTSLVHKIDL
jgi:Tol biopolymer transport system component